MAGSIFSITQTAYNLSWTLTAQLFGANYTWYAASAGSNDNPLSNATVSGTIVAYFDRDPLFTQKKAREYGKPEYFVAYDRDGPQVGDYLTNGTETYFIIDQDSLTPSKVVMTNNTVDFYRPGATPPTLPQDYRNYVRSSPGGFGQPLALQWPVSILSGSRGEKAIINELPDAGRQPWNTVLCPAIPGVVLKTDDKFKDQHGTRYQISEAELTSMGYRITARIAEG